MYLVEIKTGEVKIKRYILDKNALETLKQENPQYENIKILEEIKEIPKVKKKQIKPRY